MEETVIKVPWCFKVSECTQEQWNIIKLYRHGVSTNKHNIGMEYIKLYSVTFIGIDRNGKSDSGDSIDLFGTDTTLYTPSELVRLIQGKDKPKFDDDKWYKTTDTSYPWYVKGKFDNNGLDSFQEYINDKRYSNKSTNLGTEGTYKYEELTDLSEIQKFLPDGHVDKVKPKSERYTTTMFYFNQLREPERSQAIANYDEYYTRQIVGELLIALECGFAWKNSPQGYDYWQDIVDRVEVGTYFKEEPWVAQAGDWVCVLDKGTARNLNNGDVVQCVYAKHSYQAFIKDADGYRLHNKLYRKATQEEIDSVSKSAIIDSFPTKVVLPPTLSYIQRKALSEPIATGATIRFAEDNKTYVFGNDMWNVVEPTSEWTADNWYVKVNNQEEADEVIEAAAKIYGYEAIKSYSHISGSWEYVTLRYHNPAYCIQSMEYIKDKKERPISDFIGTITTTNNIISTVDSNVQYHSTLRLSDLVNAFSGVLSEEDFERLKNPYGKNPLTPSESHLPDLISKSKSNLLDTNINTIKSISINLQQKPKTIKL